MKNTLATMMITVLAAAGSATATGYNDLASWQAAAGSWNLANFDTDPSGGALFDGTPIGSIYSAYGLDFPDGNFISAGFGGPVSAPNGWINNTADGFGNHLFDVNITSDNIFAIGVHNVFFGSAQTGATLRAYDAAGGLLDEVDSNAVIETLDFFGVTTSSPIKRMVVTVNAGSGWGLDDLYVGTVPAPASLALLGIGGIAASRRRRA